MGMYVTVWLAPSNIAGQGRLEVDLNYIDEKHQSNKASVYRDVTPHNEYVEGTTIELWIVAALRNILSTVESAMFERLTSGQEKLILEPIEDKIP